MDVPQKEPKEDISKKEQDETKRNLQRLKTLQDDLNAKMQHIGELTGMSQEALFAILEDPSRFSKEQWLHMQKEKDRAEKEIAKDLGSEVKKRAKAKREKKLTKKRKGKMLGMRKRWLSL